MKQPTNLRDLPFNLVVYTLYALFTLACIVPFYYIFINTVSDNTLVQSGKILLLPRGVHLQNYLEVFKIRNLGQSAFISISRTLIGTVFTLIGASFPGYTLSRPEFWNRRFWYRFIVITMYFNAGIIPWFVTMKSLGLTNNFLGYVLPAFLSPFNLILFKTYIESIPSSLEESAQIDGAGYLVRYLHIIMPLAKPILATIAVFAAVGQWNSFMDTVFLMNRSSLFTLQYLLYQYLNEVNSIAQQLRSNPNFQNLDPARQLTATPIRMTISMVTVLPILTVYPFFQRYFVKGIMIGAVKG